MPKHDQHRPAAAPFAAIPARWARGPVVLYDAGVAVLAMVAVFVGLAAVILDGGSQGGTASPVAREAESAAESRSAPPAATPPAPAAHGRGYVKVTTMTPATATRYGVRYREGVLVIDVSAAHAPRGTTLLLRRLDLILTVNGHPVTNELQLRQRLAAYRGSDWVELIVLRSGRLIAVPVPADAFD